MKIFLFLFYIYIKIYLYKMKYLKNFKQLITESKGDNDLKSILHKMFKIFKTNDSLKGIWGTETINISTDVYDAFVDAKELVELPEEEIQEFADNLGVGDEEDLLISIIDVMYEEKFHRSFNDDIGLCISTLKEFIRNEKGTPEILKLSETYLDELEKIKKMI